MGDSNLRSFTLTPSLLTAKLQLGDGEIKSVDCFQVKMQGNAHSGSAWFWAKVAWWKCSTISSAPFL